MNISNHQYSGTGTVYSDLVANCKFSTFYYNLQQLPAATILPVPVQGC